MTPRTQAALHRRTLIQALGLAGASLVVPELPGLPRRRAGADSLGSVRRILFYVTSHGTVYDRWKLRPAGAREDVPFDVDLTALGAPQFSDILRPLHPHRSKLLVLDGLANAVGRDGRDNEHQMGHASCLSGFKAVAGTAGGLMGPSGPSIDQLIARRIPDKGVFPSQEWSIGGWPVCFDDAGQPIPYEIDPLAAYDRLFPSGATPQGGPPTAADRLAAADAAALGLLHDRYDALGPSLAGDDRRKIEQHRDLLRDLRARLDLRKDVSCDAGMRPGQAPDWSLPEWVTWSEDAFFRLAALTLSCGLSRVLTIRHDRLLNANFGAPPGDPHNDFAHQADTQPAAAEWMTRYHTHHAEAFAKLLAALDAIPDGDGTLLDGTICVWHNELATGQHSLVDIPVVIAGGGAYFVQGRYLRWPKQAIMQDPFTPSFEIPIGPPHNRLLVSLCRAMGLDMTSIGTESVTAFGGGAPISTKGALDRVAR